ncbi:MAG: FHA domain-containing protein [Acidobacteriota bacterium]
MAMPTLPRQQVFFEDRSFTRDVLAHSFELLAGSPRHREGILIVQDGDESFYGLMREGKVVRAGQFSGGRAFDLTVSIFEHIVGRAETAKLSLYGIEPLLFDCLDAILSREPVLRGSSRYVSFGDLARTLRREAQDAILSFGVQGEIHVAAVRKGVLSKVFFADYLAPAGTGATVLDQIEGYVARRTRSREKQDVTFALYDGITQCMPFLASPAQPAAAPEPQPSTVAGGSPVTISVSFRGKTVARVPLAKPETTIGRVKENDIVIDNLGVSRLHCVLLRTAEGIVLEDRGSLNGVVVNEEVVRRAVLKDGDVVLVGKHRLLVNVGDLAPKAPASDDRAMKGYDATMVIESKVRPDLILKALEEAGPKGALPLSEVAEMPGEVRLKAPRKNTGSFAKPKGDVVEKTARQPRAEIDSAIPMASPAPAAARKPAVRLDDLATPRTAVPAAKGGARLLFDRDTAFEMVAPVVTIGSGADADLKLDGLFVGKASAQIVRDGTGAYRIVSLSRLRKPCINGATVSGEEILFDGDEIQIGKQRFVFTTGAPVTR